MNARSRTTVSCFLMLALVFFLTSYPTSAFANAKARSTQLFGLKWPHSPEEGFLPILTSEKALDHTDTKDGFNDLLSYVLPSPYQGEAGTCLYMAITGNIEWLLRKKHNITNPAVNGPFDLSERYSANLSEILSENDLENWRTDTIYFFNQWGYTYRNEDYRFTQGYYIYADGQAQEAQAGQEGAQYGMSYNWIDHTESINAQKVELPLFERTVIHADPDHNQWSVGKAPADIAEQVKALLRKTKRPVLVIYNHFAYWHTVMIVGYNDHAFTDCSITKQSPPYYLEKYDEFVKKSDETNDPELKEKFMLKALTYKEQAQITKELYDKAGGCPGKGIFYVRDSIYPDPTEPLYDYDLNQTGEEEHYSSRFIGREYMWLRIFSNHIIQIKSL